jgi:hypothetical protein
MATRWEYCILTRLSAGLDTKWHVNRTFDYSNGLQLAEETTEKQWHDYNARFDQLHASNNFPILPAVLNILGADGWELIDDMNTGLTGGEGLVFKRSVDANAARAKRAAPRAAKTAARRRR